MMIKLDVEENKFLDKHWYVAFSGGPDSTCLIALMLKKKEQIKKKHNINIEISAIHINHNLRPVESIHDMDFCRDFCDEHNISFILYSIDVKKHAKENKMTIEQAARDMRYNIFDKYSDGYVFLGHNKDDNAETVFMNIIRGSGLQGLTGMEKVSGHYVRPLLSYTKKQIIEYNQLNNIKYVIDSSNNENYYMRNFVRNEVFPLINEKTGKDITNNLTSMAYLLKETDEYLNEQIDIEFAKRLEAQKGEVILNTLGLTELAPPIKSGVLRKGIKIVKGMLKDVEKKHIDLLLALIQNSQSGSILDIKDGIKALVLQNDRLKIYKEKKETLGLNETVDININEKTFVTKTGITIKTDIFTYEEGPVYNNGWVILHYQSVCGGLTLRTRQAKDKITPHRGNGSKTLKKYFIDNKIDSDMRDGVFILAIENEIVYIDNMEIGKKFIPKKGEKALRLEFSKI